MQGDLLLLAVADATAAGAPKREPVRRAAVAERASVDRDAVVEPVEVPNVKNAPPQAGQRSIGMSSMSPWAADPPGGTIRAGLAGSGDSRGRWGRPSGTLRVHPRGGSWIVGSTPVRSFFVLYRWFTVAGRGCTPSVTADALEEGEQVREGALGRFDVGDVVHLVEDHELGAREETV